MNSKPAPKGSAAAASQAATESFNSQSTLSLDDEASATPADQTGRRRLKDACLIKRDRILPDPEQPRKQFSKQELSELAASIQSRGFKQPLTVRWDEPAQTYRIIDGERRFRAATILKVEELPCWVQRGNRKEVLVDQIVHNWQRSDLQPFETADALARLRDEHSLNGKQLSELTGKPKSEISRLLAVHDRIVPDVQEIARRDDSDVKLTKRHLYSISTLPADKQLEVTDKVRDEKMTAAQTEKLVAGKRSNTKVRGLPARQKRFKTTNADVVMTFRKAAISEEDVRMVAEELLRMLPSSG